MLIKYACTVAGGWGGHGQGVPMSTTFPTARDRVTKACMHMHDLPSCHGQWSHAYVPGQWSHAYGPDMHMYLGSGVSLHEVEDGKLIKEN